MKAFCDEQNAPQQGDNGDGDVMTSGMCLRKTPWVSHSFFLFTEPLLLQGERDFISPQC